MYVLTCKKTKISFACSLLFPSSGQVWTIFSPSLNSEFVLSFSFSVSFDNMETKGRNEDRDRVHPINYQVKVVSQASPFGFNDINSTGRDINLHDCHKNGDRHFV